MRSAALSAAIAVALLGCPHPQPTMAPPSDAANDASSPTDGALAAADAAPVAPVSLACTSPATLAPNADTLQGLPHGSNDPWSVVPSSSQTCATAEANLRAAVKAILAAPDGGAAAPHDAWDHKATPGDFDRVAQRLALTQTEKTAIFERGFAALERHPFPTYADALHDVFRLELPIYVSIDAVLHAVFESNDALIADLEQRKLMPLLGKVLAAMHGALKAASAEWPAEVAADVDLWLAVARSLLADAPVAPVLGPQPDVAALVKQAKAATGMPTVKLFGRDRVIDFSQYLPRGHYDRRAVLRPFFRAAMWASRLELNLVSRSCRSSQPGVTPDPSETPREDLDALALAELAERGKVQAEIAELDEAWGMLAGSREDVSVAELAKLRASAGVTDLRAADAAEKLRKEIGKRFARTTRFHYMPENSPELPAIATLLGPRIVPDARAAMHMVAPAVPDRHHVGGADFAYALGADRAKAHLAGEYARFPQLAGELDLARAELQKPLACTDLYSSWLAGVRALSETPKGTLPSIMTTDAFRDTRVASAVAGLGQMRHNYVLIAAQTYDVAGCRIPDGWVDPAIGTYDALVAYAARGAEVSKKLGATSDVRYFERLGAILSVLRRIAHDELEGRALTDEEKRFLSMVVEMVPGSTGGPPTYTGWYLEMFRALEEALDGAAFVADVFTSSHTGEVDYLGVRGAMLGVFVVDAGGAPRTFVGPVTRAFQRAGTVDKRLTDATASKLKLAPDDAPWAASYVVPAPALVPMEVTLDLKTGAFTIRTKDKLTGVVLEALDEHAAVVGTVTLDTGPAKKSGTLRGKKIEYVRARAGDYSVIGDTDFMSDTATIKNAAF